MPHLQVHVPVSPLLPELASPASRNKPLPRLPTTVPAYAAASLLSLLDAADAELVLHVSRVHARPVQTTPVSLRSTRRPSSSKASSLRDPKRTSSLSATSSRACCALILLQNTSHSRADDKGVAPSLVAAKEKLQRSQLEDQLATAIAKRPPREELEEKGILKDTREEVADPASG
ncbi:hypothetical protein C8F04DRAFT_1248797 [Mycena alexandri]|uniref:Uncharacterized protein n=1 Tax=Mycena alexandri TaxID=1745969 RepID=A0AAD6TK78_9AGAR|nr:hypothetical protein C8F04DRAFT_1248797 [Mycena alexandri]